MIEADAVWMLSRDWVWRGLPSGDLLAVTSPRMPPETHRSIELPGSLGPILRRFQAPGRIGDRERDLLERCVGSGILIKPTTARAAQKPYSVRVRRSSDQLYILYQGVAHGLLLPATEFLRVSGVINANFAVLCDELTSWYLAGMGPEAPDFSALLAWKRRLFQSMAHVRERVLVGVSMGAYAAILCGHLLEVDSVIALAPARTRVSRHELWPCIETKRLDDRLLDLPALLRQHNGRTRYHVHYNASSRLDAHAAETLHGLPGVHLHAARGEGHDIVEQLVLDGSIGEALGVRA